MFANGRESFRSREMITKILYSAHFANKYHVIHDNKNSGRNEKWSRGFPKTLEVSLPHPFFPYSPLWESVCGRKCEGLRTREPFPAICLRNKAFPPPKLKEIKEAELVTTCKPAGGPSACQWCNSAEWVPASSFAENERGRENRDRNTKRKKERH